MLFFETAPAEEVEPTRSQFYITRVEVVVG